MTVSFDAVVLSGDLIPQTLPLVQATWPAVDLTAWRNFVQFFTGTAPGRESGVHGLRDASGCLCGVLACRLDWDLLAGRVLTVPLFTAIDIVNAPRTVQALLDAGETLALELGCACIHIRLSSGQAGLESRLRGLGLTPRGGHFWKEIDPAPRRN